MKTKHTRNNTNQSQLAKQLGISRQSLAYWQKMPGAPPLDALEAWRTFLAGSTRLPACFTKADRQAIAALKVRLLQSQVELSERKNAVDARQFVAAEQVREQCLKHIGALFCSLERLLVSEMPVRCKGLDEIGIYGVTKPAFDKICAECRASLGELITKEPSRE